MVHDRSVGVLYDYFAASSDEVAAAAIDLPAGPGGAMPASPELRAAIQAGDREAMRRLMAPKVRLSDHGFHALSVKGIDPIIHIGSLEELLTGATTDVISHRERSGKCVAVRDEGERLVLTLSDELQLALSEASDDQLDAVAVPWSQTEDVAGRADAGAVAHVVRELAHLARIATAANQRLYCWVCV